MARKGKGSGGGVNWASEVNEVEESTPSQKILVGMPFVKVLVGSTVVMARPVGIAACALARSRGDVSD
jgi:hypothetical protein